MLAALQRQAHQQAGVAELGRAALAGAPLSRVFDQAVTVVSAGLDLPLSNLLERLPGRDALRLVAGVGWRPGCVGETVVPAGPDTHMGNVLRSGQPVVVDDWLKTSSLRVAGFLRDHGVTSTLSVVVGPERDPFGVLCAHAITPGTIGPDDVAFCQAVANVLADAVARRRSEQALEQERALYRDLVDSQPAGVYRLRVTAGDAWRDENWRSGLDRRYVVEMATPRFCEISGVAHEDFVRNPGMVPDRIHPDDRDGFIRANVRALTELVPFVWEGRMERGDGGVWVRFESIPRVLPGGDLAWTGLLYDITGRKREEAALVAQLDELRRWKRATIGRENRVIELKREVNELMRRLGLAAPYASVAATPAGSDTGAGS